MYISFIHNNVYMYMYIYSHVYIIHAYIHVLCMYIWLTLPSNQRLIAGFGMGVADCEVGQ